MASTKYSNIRKWYSNGVWSKTKVYNAVAAGWITEEEYQEITGEEYVEE